MTTKDKITLAQWEIAARQLIESHDRGDLDGEARGWIMLRTLLEQSIAVGE